MDQRDSVLAARPESDCGAAAHAHWPHQVRHPRGETIIIIIINIIIIIIIIITIITITTITAIAPFRPGIEDSRDRARSPLKEKVFFET